MKTIIKRKTTPIKKRGQRAYDHKIAKLEKAYRKCPKIQEKYTFEQWISKVKKVG